MWPDRFALDAETEALCYRIIGACIEVHRELGPGLPECAYEAALCLELGLRGLSFERQLATSIHYKGIEVGTGRLDVLVAKKVILELKAVDTLAAIHTAQLLTYLRATDLRLGLLINFNTVRLRDGIKRILNGF
jgi:GxxExxY protein